MEKKMTLKFENKEFTLEFTRATVSIMERNGFNVNEAMEKPMTVLPRLFAGAFLSKHKFVKQDELDKIFVRIEDKEGFLGKLIEMYGEPIESLLAEPETKEGNATWEPTW
jgi:hypothetical protein